MPFNSLFIHKSPINVLGPIGKKLCDKCPIDVSNSFLSNRYTKYPFHTAFSSFNIEADSKLNLKLVRRYGVVAEASVVGPTNVMNPNVKLGMLKIEYNISPEGKLSLRPWHQIEKYPGAYYTNNDIDKLFKSFVTRPMYKKFARESSDFKWEYLSKISEKTYFDRTIIDSTQIANPLYINQLDKLFDYNKKYGGFDYNVIKSNCQTFVKYYAELATKGISNIKIKNRNFELFVKEFREDLNNYLQEAREKGLIQDVIKTSYKLYTNLKHYFNRTLNK